eukprot:m.28466 g.28466  ORF g.28466 m.28466 type:complete len:621 (-) comp15922_c1_seq1:198-2060(-)
MSYQTLLLFVATSLTSLAVRADDGTWIGFPGLTYSDLDCADILNTGNDSVASCEAKCDNTTGCTAINAHNGDGPCALRSCPCSDVALKPTGTNSEFTAYFHENPNCPPPPPPPLFANVFGSSMVLQRQPIQARLFGVVGANESLTVTVTSTVQSGASIKVSAKANNVGEWSCVLPGAEAGGPFNVTAAVDGVSTKTQTLTDVMFGDVFVCSGQSNMQEPVSVINNATLEMAAASQFPWIRLAVVGEDHSNSPLRDTTKPLSLPWQRASPAALGQNNSQSWNFFSATCWFTARELAMKLGSSVPLGLVGSYVGGTPIEDWTPPTGVLYNAMVSPLTGLALKAILWYQGENNSFKPSKWILYAQQFPTMIQLWREAWVNSTGITALSTTPFGFAQIGPRDCVPDVDHQGATGTFYGGVRWSQTAFLYHVPNAKMPNTFMAVTADLAEGYSPVLPIVAGCVHYGDKQDVGRRLVLGVLQTVYGQQNVTATGPMVVGVTLTSETLVVHFDPATGPIEVRNHSGFEVSSNGVDYVGAKISLSSGTSVTLDLSNPMQNDGVVGDGVDQLPDLGTVVSMRYILHDTPCINKTCAIYGIDSGLPSPPLVANLPGHAGADSVGWNMSTM